MGDIADDIADRWDYDDDYEESFSNPWIPFPYVYSPPQPMKPIYDLVLPQESHVKDTDFNRITRR